MIVTNVHSYWPGMRNYSIFHVFQMRSRHFYSFSTIWGTRNANDFNRLNGTRMNHLKMVIFAFDTEKSKEEEKLITVPHTSIFSPTWTSLMSFSTSSFFAVVGYHVLHMSFWPLSFLLSTPNYQQHPCFFLMTLVKKWQTKAFVWATVVYKASFPVTSSWSNNNTLALNHLNNNRTL